MFFGWFPANLSLCRNQYTVLPSASRCSCFRVRGQATLLQNEICHFKNFGYTQLFLIPGGMAKVRAQEKNISRWSRCYLMNTTVI